MKYAKVTANQGTVTDSAVSTLDSISGDTLIPSFNAAEIQVEGTDLRYTMDGNTPTSSVGFLLQNKETRLIRGDVVGKLKLISTSGNATVNIAVGNTN